VFVCVAETSGVVKVIRIVRRVVDLSSNNFTGAIPSFPYNSNPQAPSDLSVAQLVCVAVFIR
jgi:hypothetical protein